jgi:membrane associated rhomboid family serine protease
MRNRSSEGELIPIIIIILLNLLVFLAVNVGSIFFDFNLLPYLGLARRNLLAAPWILVTNWFTHADFWHILANMMTLYFFGSLLNRIAGTRYLLLTYFVGGLCADILVLLLSNPLALTIGASGCVFALGGALAVIIPKQQVFVFPIPAPIPLWVAVIVGFLILTLLPGISWQGHLGGLLFGLLMGWYLRRKHKVILY